MILVTGGTGLLGSHLLLELVRRHEEVVALKRPTSNLEEVKRVFSFHSNEAEALFKLIDWVDLDLLSAVDVERVMIDIDQVYHCAATVSFHPRDRQKMIETNIRSTSNVVNACLAANVEKMLHVSSSSAIGNPPPDLKADETMIWARSKNSTGYAISKFKSEMEVWRGMEEGLKAVVVNPTIILGPGFWQRGSSSMFRRVAGGLKFATPGMTGYVGVLDVVSAMSQLMDSDISGERFILSEGDYSYAEIFEMIAAALSTPRKMKPVRSSMLKNLARMDAISGAFTGKRMITSEHVRAAFHKARFSNEKILKAIGMQFTPINAVIMQVAGHYRSDFPG